MSAVILNIDVLLSDPGGCSRAMYISPMANIVIPRQIHFIIYRLESNFTCTYVYLQIVK